MNFFAKGNWKLIISVGVSNWFFWKKGVLKIVGGFFKALCGQYRNSVYVMYGIGVNKENVTGSHRRAFSHGGGSPTKQNVLWVKQML